MVAVTSERPATRARSPRHQQVTVRVAHCSAEIDEGVAPLIEALWQLGIRTVHSCQSITRTFNLMREPDERFYVMFDEVDDLRRMLGLFVDTPLDPRRLITTWQFALFVRGDDTQVAELPEVGLRPVVYVPVRHLAAITSIAQQHAAQHPRTHTEWSILP